MPRNFIPFHIAGDKEQYEEKSIEMLKEFVENCLNILGNNPFLWIALQSNVICDYSITSKDFKTRFRNMINHLTTNKGFYSPKLNYNMRNSHDVTELSNNLISQMINIEKTDVIDEKICLTNVVL